jgi:hypothetical protein
LSLPGSAAVTAHIWARGTGDLEPLVNPSVWQFMVAPSLNPALNPNANQKYLAERYFRPPPLAKEKYLAVALLDVGAAVAIFSLVMLVLGGSAVFWIGLALGIMGLTVGWFRLEEYGRQFNWASPKATDIDMDLWLSQQLRNVEQEAMKQLAIAPADLHGTAGGAVGFDPWQGGPHLVPPSHRGPFTIFGPVLEPKVHRVGNDGVWRFRSYEVMVLCPTTRSMGVYECILNTATGKRSKIELREYDYSDIVVLSLVDRPTNLGLAWQPGQGAPQFAGGRGRLREVQIAVASGDNSKIVAGIDFPLIQRGWVRLQPSGLEDFVQCTRRLLRTKRRTG